ncbi:MAG: hypothetical protein ACRCX2_35680 [Paraclostridium sp.]
MDKRNMTNVRVFLPGGSQLFFPIGIESINYFKEQFLTEEPLVDRKMTLIGASFEINIKGAIGITFDWNGKSYEVDCRNGEILERR